MLNNMKRINTTLLILSITFGLFSSNNNFEITLKVDSINDCNVVIQRFTPRGAVTDTFKLVNGVAKIETFISDTVLLYVGVHAEDLAFRNPIGGPVYHNFTVMAAPNESYELEAILKAKRPPIVKAISAGPIGTDFAKLQYDILDPIERESKQLIISNIIAQGDIRHYPVFLESVRRSTRMAIDSFIDNNPTSYMALYYYFMNYNWFDENQIEENISKMSPELQNSRYAENVKAKLDHGRKNRLGAVAPNFTRTSIKGTKTSLSDFKGKYVLLDFWGSWCAPCRASHPHLIKIYNEYNPKGLVFIGVSMEYGNDINKIREEWSKAIAEDGLEWTQLLENEDPKDSISRAYNITSVPAKILISPEGKIIAKYIGNSDELDKKLKEIFE